MDFGEIARYVNSFGPVPVLMGLGTVIIAAEGTVDYFRNRTGQTDYLQQGTEMTGLRDYDILSEARKVAGQCGKTQYIQR